MVLLAGCARRVAPSALKEDAPHLGPDWFTYRGKGVALAPDAALARDATLPEDAPPNDVWDEQLRAEARAIWLQSCASCHGKRGKNEDVVFAPGVKPPRKWGTVGTAMGFTFGGDKMRAGIYRTIRDGRPDTPMVAWKPSLSREQIWALVFFLEEL